MKIKSRFTALALGLAGGVLSATQTQAVLTSYSPGDLFIGFRTTTSSNTLLVNIGQASLYSPASLGGTAGTTPFNVQFGLVPNTLTPVFNLNDDLVDTFGANWAANPGNGTGVRWAVVGFTDNSLDNTPTAGLTARSIYITKARTNPAVQSATLGSVNHDTFSGNFQSLIYGGATSYDGRNSTDNSTEAYIGAASGASNWNTLIGANGSFGLGASRRVEQAASGLYSGPTDSVLDLYLAPNADSTLATSNTYLGSFSLSSSGVLTFTPVPEPSTALLLAISGTAIMAFRRRNRSVPSAG